MKVDVMRLVAVVAVFGIVVGTSFGAGTVYGRSTSTSSAAAQTASSGGAGRSGTPGAGGRGRFSGTPGAFSGTPGAFSGTPGPGGGFGGRQVTGSIQSITGTTLSLTTQAGTQLSVTLADTTKIGNVTTGDKTTLTPGGSVLIVGQRQADGSMSATSVLVLPAGFLGP